MIREVSVISNFPVYKTSGLSISSQSLGRSVLTNIIEYMHAHIHTSHFCPFHHFFLFKNHFNTLSPNNLHNVLQLKFHFCFHLSICLALWKCEGWPMSSSNSLSKSETIIQHFIMPASNIMSLTHEAPKLLLRMISAQKYFLLSKSLVTILTISHRKVNCAKMVFLHYELVSFI